MCGKDQAEKRRYVRADRSDYDFCLAPTKDLLALMICPAQVHSGTELM